MGAAQRGMRAEVERTAEHAHERKDEQGDEPAKLGCGVVSVTVAEKGTPAASRSALLDAAKKGNVTRVQKLLTPDNINCRDCQGRNSTPLHLAAGYNNLEGAERLLESDQCPLLVSEEWSKETKEKKPGTPSILFFLLQPCLRPIVQITRIRVVRKKSPLN